MISDTERREVARRLRDLPGDSTYPDLIGAIADRDGWYPAADAADRLADLIEPSCDRDALIELADEMKEKVLVYDRLGLRVSTRDVMRYARRIREALGVDDG